MSITKVVEDAGNVVPDPRFLDAGSKAYRGASHGSL